MLDSMLPRKCTPRYEPVERKAPEEIGNGMKESENYWQHSATARVESSFFRVKRKKTKLNLKEKAIVRKLSATGGTRVASSLPRVNQASNRHRQKCTLYKFINLGKGAKKKRT